MLLERVSLPNRVGVVLRGLDPEQTGSSDEWKAETEERFVYWHHWQPDDLVTWNNDRTLHCAFGHQKKYPRGMNRTTLQGEADGRLAA